MKENLKELITKLHPPKWKSWALSQSRCEAATALGKTGNKEAIPPLIQALEDNDDSVSLAAAEALETFHDPSTVEPFIKALERKESIAMIAAEALGNLQDRRAVPSLIKALDRSELGGNIPEAPAINTLILRKIEGEQLFTPLQFCAKIRGCQKI